jgi:hypothetical protein
MSAAMPAEYVDAFFDFYVTGTLDESQPQAHAGAFRPS